MRDRWGERISQLLDLENPRPDDQLPPVICDVCRNKVRYLEKALLQLDAFKQLAKSCLTITRSLKRTKETSGMLGVSPDTCRQRPRQARRRLSFGGPNEVVESETPDNQMHAEGITSCAIPNSVGKETDANDGNESGTVGLVMHAAPLGMECAEVAESIDTSASRSDCEDEIISREIDVTGRVCEPDHANLAWPAALSSNPPVTQTPGNS